MGADASIYSMIRPPEKLAGPLDNYSAMMQLRSMMDASEMHGLQRQKLTTDLAEEDAFKSKIADWARAGGQGAVSPEAWAASPTRAAAFEKTRVETEKAHADLHKTKLESLQKQAELTRNIIAGVNSDADMPWAAEQITKLHGPDAVAKSPFFQGPFDPQKKTQMLATGDEAIKQLQPKMEKVDIGGTVKMVDVNPITNPSIRTMEFKKVIAPGEAAHIQIQAATADPFGTLGIQDIAKRATGGQGSAPAAGATPAAAAASSGGTNGDEFLKTLSKPMADQVKALAEGRMSFPGGFALKSPYWQQMISMVSQYDPNFDAVNYNARAGVRKDFTSGKSASSLNALNTVMGHLDDFEKSATALNNTDYPLVNTALNVIGSNASPDLKARLNKFNLTKQAVVSEMERAYRGTGGSQADIESWKKTLNDSDSPEAIRASIQQGVKLLGSKIEALGDQYSKGMGATADGLQLLNPKARDAYNRLLTAAPGKPAAAPGSGIKFLGFE